MIVLSGRRATAPSAILGMPATGAITSGCRLIFAFLFGLSMDYEVFILARMREEYDDRGDTTTRPSSPASAGPGAWSPSPR